MPGPIQTDGAQLNGLAQNLEASAAAVVVQGSYDGDNVVQLPSQQSLLTEAFKDSIEERTASVAEHQEKELSKRDISQGSKVDQMARILKIQEIEKMLAPLKDLDKNKLAKMLAELTSRQNQTPRQLREHIKQQFKEPAHQYAALQALIVALKQQNASPQQLAAAQKALTQLMAEDGDAVRAGVNVNEAALAAAKQGLGSAQSNRDSYRDAVLDYPGLPQTFDMLREKYPPEKLPDAIKFFLKALGDDLAAAGSSIEKSKLNAILNDMYRLKLLASVLERSNKLIAQTKGGLRANIVKRGADLVAEILNLQSNKWINPEQIAPLPQKMGIADPSKQINFLNGFKELIRALPEKAFADNEQAIRMKDAVQICLDEAIDREEEEEA